jgi:hypothetical protein
MRLALFIIVLAVFAWAILCGRLHIDGAAFLFGLVLFVIAAVAVVAANVRPLNDSDRAGGAAGVQDSSCGSGRGRV